MLDQVVDKVRGKTQGFLTLVRQKILGTNNERLDLLMDSFYSLSPQKQAGIVLGAAAGGVVMLILVFVLYFVQLNALDRDLNKSFNALHQLRQVQSLYEKEEATVRKLVSTVSRRTNTLRVKPFFEEKAGEIGVSIKDLNDAREDLPAESYLADKMQYVKVDVRMPKVSIPRLLNFLIEIEKSNQYLSTEDLQIRTIYGTKLYFDVKAKVRGYAVKGQ